MKIVVLLLGICLFPKLLDAQVHLFETLYKSGEIQDGSYRQKSLSDFILKKDLPIIQQDLNTVENDLDIQFLNPFHRKIVLFKNHDENELKAAALLTSLVKVKVDSIIYKKKYSDLSNQVWNRIYINNEVYFTDADLHDFKVTENLKQLEQHLIVVGQKTGYDGAYHLGYPEYLFLIFTDANHNIIDKIAVVDLVINDEFALKEDLIELAWNDNDKLYTITIKGHKKQMKALWNGKEFQMQ